ncbi:zinc finger protein [Macleaya cordata]|uniref:Zinc finger protein n=1 Tax=Macleaya cordata TaxID=56857 RepID=A0A200R5N1_MACCD|nr:zinc finger protein [Macleaya cordata]
MASRQLQRRISSIFLRNQPHNCSSSWPILPSTKMIDLFGIDKRAIQTNAGSTDNNNIKVADEIEEDQNSTNKMINQGVVGGDSENSSSVKYSAISSLKTSERHDLAMVFTCKVCETRSVKTACRESYEKGVVVARCGGCNNLHLIADRLGWFGEPGSIEELLAARGEEVRKGSVDSLNLTLEDLAGISKPDTN